VEDHTRVQHVFLGGNKCVGSFDQRQKKLWAELSCADVCVDVDNARVRLGKQNGKRAWNCRMAFALRQKGARDERAERKTLYTLSLVIMARQVCDAGPARPFGAICHSRARAYLQNVALGHSASVH